MTTNKPLKMPGRLGDKPQAKYYWYSIVSVWTCDGFYFCNLALQEKKPYDSLAAIEATRLVLAKEEFASDTYVLESGLLLPILQYPGKAANNIPKYALSQARYEKLNKLITDLKGGTGNV